MVTSLASYLTPDGLEDETTLRLLATGLVQMADTFPPIKVPYPALLQRGLNHLAWRGIQTGSPVVSGLAEFLAWARQPVAEWPIPLKLGTQDALAPSDTLLAGPDGDRPTEICEELALGPSADSEAESLEERLIIEVLKLCQRPGGDRTYTAYRRLLITRPVLTEDDLFTACEQPELELLNRHVRLNYPLAPLALASNGQFAICPLCQNLLQRSAFTGLFVCLDSTCDGIRGATPATFLPVRDQVHWLRRELRRFVARPGRAEIDLAQRLDQVGVSVELWPNVDAYDLRITFTRSNDIWAVDVKDWANAYYLANAVKPFRHEPRWTRAFFVFPEARRDSQGHYLTTFTKRCKQRMKEAPSDSLTLLDARCQALFVDDFVRLVQRQLRGRRTTNA